MKLSRYNHIIKKDGYSYWYNGISHTYFRLSAETGRKLRDNLQYIEEIKGAYPTIYDKLVDGGFIIENEVDEYDIILKRAEAARDDRNAL